MKTIAILIGVLFSCSAGSDEIANTRQEPSVEILGVKITRGMPEAEVRAAIPNIHCDEENPVDPRFHYCGVSSGEFRGDEGEITFKDGFVYSATRNWFIPEGTDPWQVQNAR